MAWLSSPKPLMYIFGILRVGVYSKVLFCIFPDMKHFESTKVNWDQVMGGYEVTKGVSRPSFLNTTRWISALCQFSWSYTQTTISTKSTKNQFVYPQNQTHSNADSKSPIYTPMRCYVLPCLPAYWILLNFKRQISTIVSFYVIVEIYNRDNKYHV